MLNMWLNHHIRGIVSQQPKLTNTCHMPSGDKYYGDGYFMVQGKEELFHVAVRYFLSDKETLGQKCGKAEKQTKWVAAQE